jgi:glutathione reductase (NADPH)
MQAFGVDIVTEATVAEIQLDGDQKSVRLSNGHSYTAGVVMFAIGRAPNTRGLGLENAGVKLTEAEAIAVDAYSRSSTPSIWAIGDVTNRVNLTPVAIREAHCFFDSAFRDAPTALDYSAIPTAVFGRPPVGAVGYTEAEARARFSAIDIFRTTFRPMRNILAGNAERTLMKLVVRREDNVVLGVHLAGVDAPEMVQLAAIAVKAGLTKAQWDSTIALHPTAAEELVLLREPVPTV